MEIKFDEKQLQEAIVSQIATTTFGTAITKAVNEALTKSCYNRDSIIDSAAKEEVRRVVGIIVSEEIQKKKEEIRAKALEQLTDEVFNQMISTAIDIMAGRLKVEH